MLFLSQSACVYGIDAGNQKFGGKCYNLRVMDKLKLVIEKHSDGFVSYPLGLKGVVVGQGDTYEEALADIESAINFHIETFGPDAFESDSPVLEAFIAETRLAA